MGAHIAVDRSEIAEFCKRNRIRKLAFFGSVLRDDFHPDSDVDVLVEFAPDQKVGFFRLLETERELSDLLGGCTVDLVTYNALNRHLRDRVIAASEVQYEER